LLTIAAKPIDRMCSLQLMNTESEGKIGCEKPHTSQYLMLAEELCHK